MVVAGVSSVIIDKIIDGAPWILGYVAVFVAGVWGTRFYYKKFKAVDDRTKHANCPVNSQRIAESEKIQQELRDSMIAIRTVLMSSEHINTSALSAKYSPRKLTELGEKILKESNGDVFVETHLDELIKRISVLAPQTAYDVEKCALSILLSMSELPEFNGLKNYVYGAPSINNDDGSVLSVRLADVCFVMSLPLRDRYLEIHPEIDPFDYSNE